MSHTGRESRSKAKRLLLALAIIAVIVVPLVKWVVLPYWIKKRSSSTRILDFSGVKDALNKTREYVVPKSSDVQASSYTTSPSSTTIVGTTTTSTTAPTTSAIAKPAGLRYV